MFIPNLSGVADAVEDAQRCSITTLLKCLGALLLKIDYEY